MHQFGGRLDARNGKNETPAHICAKTNPANRTSPTALGFLYDVAPRSFQVLDANNQKPEDIAQKEKNQAAQLFFANLRAKINAEEARHFLKQKDDILEEEMEMGKKWEDSFRKVGGVPHLRPT